MHLQRIKELITQQFPEYADLTITPVQYQGHDNRSYHLGSDLLIRLPSSSIYAEKIPLEYKLLHELNSKLTFKIPIPINLGEATKIFPFQFAIYKWIEGDSLNSLTLDPHQQSKLAKDLANCLNELHCVKTSYKLIPGQHNWWRGAHISVYADDTKKQLKSLSHYLDTQKINNILNQALNTQWRDDPVWIHGDIAVGNLIIKDNNLDAIIDFGCSAVGDPACDLVIAWTYFTNEAQECFIQNINQSNDVWLRAKAWAIWKSTFELTHINKKNNIQAEKQFAILDSILNNNL